MHVFRLRYTALGLLIYIQSAFCWTKPSDSDFDDVASRTVLAAVVFEGRAHRVQRTPERPGQYYIRFKVLQIFKGTGTLSPDGGGVSVSGNDTAAGTTPKPRGQRVLTVDTFASDRKKNCSKPEMESRYIVFLAGDETDLKSNRRKSYKNNNNNASSSLLLSTSLSSLSSSSSTDFVYRTSSCPELTSATISREVRKYACNGCTRRARVRRIYGGKEIASGQKVRLHCQASGKPRPIITWYKDGVRLTQNDRLLLTQRKSRSQLEIRRTHANDSGLYQCQAVNVLGRTGRIGTTLGVKQEPRKKPHSKPCPHQGYCLNGGTCYVMTSLKKDYCECPKDYVGSRCEEKFTIQNIKLVLGRDQKRKRSHI